ncbi:MAG: FAD:protein FMN transferase, partial [Mariprofundus sp.]
MANAENVWIPCQQFYSGKNSAMFRFLTLLLLLISTACSAPADVRETRFIMGTLVEFTIAAEHGEHAEAAITAAANEMQRIEDAFTVHGTIHNSVKAFNASIPGTPVELPDEVASLLELALTIKKQSGGAFDPALGKLNQLWGFSGSDLPSSPPEAEQIQAAIAPAHCIEKHHNGWIRKDNR